MAERKRSAGLGRGLSALLDEIETGRDDAGGEASPTADRLVPVARIRPNPAQPRRQFDEEALNELAESLKRQGMLQPILVRPRTAGDYEIVAGERRWRAAQLAQLHEVPVVVRELDDAATLEVALIENVQRADLNAIEEAEGYRRLIGEFGYTQDAVGRFVGKSRSHVANMLRLLDLPEEVRALVLAGDLSMGHARALVTADDPVDLARRVVAEQLSVRQTEMLARKAAGRGPGISRHFVPAAPGGGKDPDVAAIEAQISEMIGLTVTIDQRGHGGSLTVSYKALEQLDFILQRLSGGRI